MEPMMAQQAMAPAFFYYNPEPNPENRHHGHFIAHPQAQAHHAYAPHHMQQPMQVFPQVPVLPSTPLPSTPVFSRPSSSCSQPPMPQQAKPSFTSAPQQVLTPQASPVRMHQPLHRPTIVLDMDKFDPADSMCYPQTPPLSSAGSVMGSPGGCDMLATPLNPMFSGLEGTPMCIKEEVDVLPIEQFPALDWDTCASPPMTPGKFIYIYFQLFCFGGRFGERSRDYAIERYPAIGLYCSWEKKKTVGSSKRLEILQRAAYRGGVFGNVRGIS